MQTVYNLIGEDLKIVEQKFLKYLESDTPLIRRVGEYVLSSGGKRVRPALLLLSAKLCNYNGDKGVTIGSVIEFIHTATLLHDDVVDSATLRRGLASANTLWGNEASVLIGDYLFSKSFSMMVEVGSMDILRILSGATTLITEGEVMQLLCTGDIELTEERYVSVVRAKTAILMAAACESGAVLGGVSEAEQQALSSFGMELGMAFQLMDDSLDYVASEEDFGKSIGHDLEEGKITLPLIHTLRQCSKEEHALITAVIEKEGMTPEDFKAVSELVNRYGGIEYTVTCAQRYIENCRVHLDMFKSCPAKDALLELADYILVRNR